MSGGRIDLRRRQEPATTDEVIEALNAACLALLSAAGAMIRRYGADTEKVIQLCGAAAMVRDDWIPAIRAEAAELDPL
jgi:hypothetical protein